MGKNKKQTSKEIASKAAKILTDPNASKIQKELAGSAMSQANTGNQTGAEMETKASKVLKSIKYSKETKEIAATVLSQANKER